MKSIKFLLTMCVFSLSVTACNNSNEQPKKATEEVKTSEEVQKDWSKRNQSNKDFDSHESKGF